MRLSYPDNIRVIQVPCTGRVDVMHILKALEEGADGVYLAGCLEGECHFVRGNLRARKRVEYVQKILEQIGVEKERVAMYNLSSSMGQKFAQFAEEMTTTIKALGPGPMAVKCAA